MKHILVVLMIMGSGGLLAQVSIVSWNLCEFGGTKDNAELDAIVQAVRDHDIVCLQEVVAKDPAGAQKVAQLADLLDRTGANWDYRVSDPTDSPSAYISERYAFLWNTSKVRMVGRPELMRNLAAHVDREPFVGKFRYREKEFSVVNYHSRAHDKQPEEELVHILDYILTHDDREWILLGDFNLFDDHEVLDLIYEAGYSAVLRSTPTTLKRSCDGDKYTNYAIDNIFYRPSALRKLHGGVIDLVKGCWDLERVLGVSDHLGVWVEVE